MWVLLLPVILTDGGDDESCAVFLTVEYRCHVRRDAQPYRGYIAYGSLAACPCATPSPLLLFFFRTFFFHGYCVIVCCAKLYNYFESAKLIQY